MPLPPIPTDLAVHDLGGPAGAPVLFLMHGVTDSAGCWTDAVCRWSPRWRLLAWDARGHGDSPAFTREQLELGPAEVMLTDAIAILEALAAHGTRPVLVAHSMGAGTAAAVLATRPDLVRGAVLEDPALGRSPGTTPEMLLAAGHEMVEDALRWREDPTGQEARGRAENPSWPPSEYAGWASAKLRTDLGMLATGQVRLPRPPLEVAADIGAPALVVTAEESFLWDEARRTALSALGNPQLRVEAVAGAGHCVRRDQPDRYHALVDPWLEALAHPRQAERPQQAEESEQAGRPGREEPPVSR